MKYVISLFFLLLLTSCSNVSLNSSFACGAGKGLGCKSVSEVNDIVETSLITNEGIIPSGEKSRQSKVSTLAYTDGASLDYQMPERVPEKRIKIWFAPHVDAYDNYVEETVVYAVIKEAHWSR